MKNQRIRFFHLAVTLSLLASLAVLSAEDFARLKVVSRGDPLGDVEFDATVKHFESWYEQALSEKDYESIYRHLDNASVQRTPLGRHMLLHLTEPETGIRELPILVHCIRLLEYEEDIKYFGKDPNKGWNREFALEMLGMKAAKILRGGDSRVFDISSMVELVGELIRIFQHKFPGHEAEITEALRLVALPKPPGKTTGLGPLDQPNQHAVDMTPKKDGTVEKARETGKRAPAVNASAPSRGWIILSGAAIGILILLLWMLRRRRDRWGRGR